MNKINISAIVPAISLAYSVNAMVQNMSKTECKAAEENCGSFAANAKESCVNEAKKRFSK